MIFKRPAGFIKIVGSYTIKLPNECFVCSGNAQKKFTLHGTYFLSYFIFYWSYRKMKLPVPVCKQHFLKLTTLRFFFWILFVGIFISGALVFIAYLNQNDLVSHSKFILIGCVFFFLVVSYIYVSMKNGLKIVSILDNETIFSSNREDYFLKLCELEGAEVVLPPGPFWNWF